MSGVDNLRLPRFLIDWAHLFRVKLNPRYSDEAHDTGVVVRSDIETIKGFFEKWGFEMNMLQTSRQSRLKNDSTH